MAFEATTATRRILEIESFKYCLGVLSMFAMPGAASQQISAVSGSPSTTTENSTRGLYGVCGNRRPARCRMSSR
jgi:hypothetical protein